MISYRVFCCYVGCDNIGYSDSSTTTAALTAILAATIVYGVFYTKIVKNVQMFGQLRTVGMTKRQIKRMASKEGRLYALAGIPLGLVIGVLIGFIGCPDGFRLKQQLFMLY